jgi:hypothetical protein
MLAVGLVPAHQLVELEQAKQAPQSRLQLAAKKPTQAKYRALQ